MNDIRFSPASLKDLEEIEEYISSELQNPEAAVNTISKITKSIHILDDLANAGTPLYMVADFVTDHRFLISGNYIIFYRVNAGEVYIDRILYKKRDYIRALFKDFIKDQDDNL